MNKRNINNLSGALLSIAQQAKREQQRNKRSMPGYGSLDRVTWKPQSLTSENDFVAKTLSWRRSSMALGLPIDSRVLCMDCHGTGVHQPWVFIAGCERCITDKEGHACDYHAGVKGDGIREIGCKDCRDPLAMRPCPRHACKRCNGSGLVCPACMGMRFRRYEWPDMREGRHEQLCSICCEGNQVSPLKERRAITRYLEREASRKVASNE